MKLFISIPTRGRADSEVEAEKAAILDRIRAAWNKPVELIDSYISKDAPVDGDAAGAWYLGESIRRLATADTVYFADGWEKARGCRIERAVCEAYNIPIYPNNELHEAIEHLQAMLGDPNHDWGCKKCQLEHEQLLRWLLKLRELTCEQIPVGNVEFV